MPWEYVLEERRFSVDERISLDTHFSVVLALDIELHFTYNDIHRLVIPTSRYYQPDEKE